MSRDDGLDVPQPLGRLCERRRVLDARPAVRVVHERHLLAGEQIAGVHGPQFREDDKRVAVGVSAPEVVQLDAIAAAPDCHAILERAIGHGVGLSLQRVHPFHVGLRVFVRDHLYALREVLVAADVVAMCMRVDDRRHRLVRDRFHLLHDALAPVGELGVDEHDTLLGDEGGRIPSTSRDDEEIFLYLLDLSRLRLLALASRGARRDGETTDGQ